MSAVGYVKKALDGLSVNELVQVGNEAARLAVIKDPHHKYDFLQQARGSAAPKAAMTGSRKPPFWMKAITRYDRTKTSGYAFDGDWTSPRKLKDLPDGKVVVVGMTDGDLHYYAVLEKAAGVRSTVNGHEIENVYLQEHGQCDDPHLSVADRRRQSLEPVFRWLSANKPELAHDYGDF